MKYFRYSDNKYKRREVSVISDNCDLELLPKKVESDPLPYIEKAFDPNYNSYQSKKDDKDSGDITDKL